MEKVHFMDLSYAMVKAALQRHDFRPGVKRGPYLNPRCTTSIWAKVAADTLETNAVPHRTFASDFYRLFNGQEREMQHHFPTTLSTIAIYVNGLPEEQKQNKNLRQATSVWGILSQQMYGINEFVDRKFLSELWAIGCKVEDLGEIACKTLAPPTFTTTIDRRKRTRKKVYDKQRYKPPPAETRTYTPRGTPHIHSLDRDQLIQRLSDKFRKEITRFATAVCDVCNKLVYDDHQHRKSLLITPALLALFQTIDQNYSFPTSKSNLLCCMRCHTNLTKGKIPPQALVNNMQLPPRPPQISSLTPAEIRLISQIKPYMKVYNLLSGRGQKAVKGLVVHFPNDISEVTEQLPRKASDSDIIIAYQKGSDLQHTESVKIRPNKIYAALEWLVNNNPLYRNVKIDGQVNIGEIPSICIDPSPTNVISVSEENHVGVGYTEALTGFSILRGSVSQAHEQFGVNAGRQCTAMAASFLAHTVVQSPDSWIRPDFDQILLIGNRYFDQNVHKIPNNEIFLNAEDVQGCIKAFGAAEVELSIDHDSQAFELQGYGNKCQIAGVKRMDEVISHFLRQGFTHGILTCGVYSMGIFSDGEFVYYFDSHGRGANGGQTRSTSGRACILKIHISSASRIISRKANRVCFAGVHAENSDALQLVLTTFKVERKLSEEEDPDDDQEKCLDSPTASPLRKVPRNVEPDLDSSDSESDDDNSDNEGTANIRPEQELQFLPFEGLQEVDCVVDRDDYDNPSVDDVLKILRECRTPVKDREENKDLLSFVDLFPHGSNGVDSFRKVHQTKADYYQARVMGADERFRGNSQYLFYSLAETEKQRIKQKIAVCCAQVRQGDPNAKIEELGDAYSFMSSIRGTGAYWKKYCGDVIAMAKSLGSPTFFLTFSYDDLNSEDSLMAFWKATHGPDAECNPADIPMNVRKTFLNSLAVTAARHFSMRLSKFFAFLKANSMEIFGREMLDYTVRVEFQARGSPHAHSLIWLKDAPAWESPEGIEFLERNVSCSLSTKYEELVSKYQRHRHTPTCFKDNRQYCRFAFPRPEEDETKILNESEATRHNGRFFALKRSKQEEFIGYYHPILLPILKCNMDIQPVTSSLGVVYYIAKYIGKGEPTELRKQVHDSIAAVKNSDIPYRDKLFKVSMAMMRAREVCVQEAAFRTCHLFLRYNTRATVFLPAFPPEKRIRMLKRDSLVEGTTQFCPNIIERYMGRPRNLEHLSLYEFAAYYQPVYRDKGNNVSDDDVIEYPDEEPDEEVDTGAIITCKLNGREVGRMARRKRPQVVKYPNFHPMTDRNNYHYCMLLLYLPFREENFCSDKNPVEVFSERHGELRTSRDDPVINSDLSDEIDRALLRVADFDENETNEWGMEAPLDAQYEDHDPEMPLRREDFFVRQDNENLLHEMRRMVAQLNPEQRQLFDKVKAAVARGDRNFRYILQAEAGCGKTFLYKVLTRYIKATLGEDTLIISASTGKAAFPISGLTTHRAFGLRVQRGFIKPYEKLTPRRLGELKRLYRNVKWIFIDEISMVSYQNFRAIHLRLCEIFGTDGTEPFAALNVLVSGDLMQLPPVKSSKIFKKPAAFGTEPDLWRMFKFFEMKLNMRQGNDPLAKICSELRVGKMTQESLELLYTRVINGRNGIKGDEIKEFDTAVRIYPLNRQCEEYNRRQTRLLRSKVRTFKIEAYDTYADGVKQGQKCPDNLTNVTEDISGGIPKQIELGIGSRIMLRRNLDTENGQVNGVTGVVQDIKWSINSNGPVNKGELPKAVVIKFDHENFTREIRPTPVDFVGKKQQRVTRLMLPLILSWAISVHKAQGASVDKAVIKMNYGRIKGLLYVALSRCTTLKGVAIEGLDPKLLLGHDKWNPCDMEALAELERLRQEASVLDDNYELLYPSAPIAQDMENLHISIHDID